MGFSWNGKGEALEKIIYRAAPQSFRLDDFCSVAQAHTGAAGVIHLDYVDEDARRTHETYLRSIMKHIKEAYGGLEGLNHGWFYHLRYSLIARLANATNYDVVLDEPYDKTPQTTIYYNRIRNFYALERVTTKDSITSSSVHLFGRKKAMKMVR